MKNRQEFSPSYKIFSLLSLLALLASSCIKNGVSSQADSDTTGTPTPFSTVDPLLATNPTLAAQATLYTNWESYAACVQFQDQLAAQETEKTGHEVAPNYQPCDEIWPELTPTPTDVP